MARLVQIVEIAVGFVVPLIIGGPFILLGLLLGLWVLIRGAEPIPFVPSLGGLFGLIALGNLYFRKQDMTQRQIELATGGVLSGIASVVWVLTSSARSANRADLKGWLFWAVVLLPPAILGMRRIVLLWRPLHK
jgi:hypothetical protein